MLTLLVQWLTNHHFGVKYYHEHTHQIIIMKGYTKYDMFSVSDILLCAGYK